MICQDGTNATATNDGQWGFWYPAVFCPEKSVICGIRVQMESYEIGKDNTALNNVDFKCCPLNI